MGVVGGGNGVIMIHVIAERAVCLHLLPRDKRASDSMGSQVMMMMVVLTWPSTVRNVARINPFTGSFCINLPLPEASTMIKVHLE